MLGQRGSSGVSVSSRNLNAGYVVKEVKLQKLCEEDIEHYFTTFERIAGVSRWPREDWAIRLIPLLMGKACSAYVAMDVMDAREYAHVN